MSTGAVSGWRGFEMSPKAEMRNYKMQYRQRLLPRMFAIPSAILFTLLSAPAGAGSLPEAPYVSTSAEARIEAVPDHATLQVRVERIADEPDLVRQRINAIQSELVAVGERYGDALAKFDLHGFEFGAHREYRQDMGRMVDRGFRGGFALEIELNDLKRLDALLFDLSGLELSGLGSPQFGVRDVERYQDEARSEALAAARVQALALAASQGATLGEIWGIVYLPMDRLADQVGRDGGDAIADGWAPRFREASAADAGFVLQTRIAPITFTARAGVIYRIVPGAAD